MTEERVSLAAIIRECDELFMCPSLDAQIAACVFAEKEARELRLCGIDPETGKYLQEPLRTPEPPAFDALKFRMTQLGLTGSGASVASAMSAQRQPMVRMAPDYANATSSTVDPNLLSNEWTSDYIEPALRSKQVAKSSSWSVGRNRVYLTQMPQEQREVVVPRPYRGAYPPVHYTKHGPHHVVWSFATDLFTCERCGQAVAVMRDFDGLVCAEGVS